MHTISTNDLEFSKCSRVDPKDHNLHYDIIVDHLEDRVPRIPSKIRNCICYIILGEQVIGTGFLTHSVNDSGEDEVFVTTNQHVVNAGIKHGCELKVRFNKALEGGVEELSIGNDQWQINENEYDIAVCRIDLQHLAGGFCIVSETIFATKEDMYDEVITLGDDVFMLGYYENAIHDSDDVNPAAKFGNISRLPIKNDNRFYMDIRSRSGFSGSPVFMYRTPMSDLNLNSLDDLRIGEKRVFKFCGIHKGQMPESIMVDGNVELKQVTVNSGVTIVIPAWEISSTIQQYRKNFDK